MKDEEIGAAVRLALARGALATLTLRRGHDDGTGSFAVALHVYAEHRHPDHPEAGVLAEGEHRLGCGVTLDAALETALAPVGARSSGRGS